MVQRKNLKKKEIELNVCNELLKYIINSNYFQIIDKSHELNQLYENLIESSRKLEEENKHTPLVPLSKIQLATISVNSQTFTPNSKEFFVHLILESIRKENYPIAVECFKMAQNHWPTEFAKTLQIDDFNIDLLMFIVCENIRMRNSSKRFFFSFLIVNMIQITNVCFFFHYFFKI